MNGTVIKTEARQRVYWTNVSTNTKVWRVDIQAGGWVAQASDLAGVTNTVGGTPFLRVLGNPTVA
jgi:hypothetical protein